jgi:hypothetical protein
MIGIFRLNAMGFTFRWEVEYLSHDKNHYSVTMKLELNSKFNYNVIESEPIFVSQDDVISCVSYLQSHITNLISNHELESFDFAGSELGFVLQALSGYIEPNREGCFGIRVMLCVGREPDNDTHVYLGCESDVCVDEVDEFCKALSTLIETKA